MILANKHLGLACCLGMHNLDLLGRLVAYDYEH
jgi:hypothetical protein